MRRTTWVGAAGLALLVPTVGVVSYSIAQAAESTQQQATGVRCEHGTQTTTTDWAPLAPGEEPDLAPVDAIATYLEPTLRATAAQRAETTGVTTSTTDIAIAADAKAATYERGADIDGNPTLRSADADPSTPTEVVLERRGAGWAVSITRTCAPAEVGAR